MSEQDPEFAPGYISDTESDMGSDEDQPAAGPHETLPYFPGVKAPYWKGLPDDLDRLFPSLVPTEEAPQTEKPPKRASSHNSWHVTNIARHSKEEGEIAIAGKCRRCRIPSPDCGSRW